MVKVVETELDEKDYMLLKVASEKAGLTLKEGLREAARDWAIKRVPLSEDPIFRLQPKKTGVKTDSSRMDEQKRQGDYG